MKISRIGFGNFRVFQEETEFEIADITLLTGVNNSGKSSLIKGMLLLNESSSQLKFQGDNKHKLGSFENCLNTFSNSETITVRIAFCDAHFVNFYNTNYFIGEAIKVKSVEDELKKTANFEDHFFTAKEIILDLSFKKSGENGERVSYSISVKPYKSDKIYFKKDIAELALHLAQTYLSLFLDSCFEVVMAIKEKGGDKIKNHSEALVEFWNELLADKDERVLLSPTERIANTLILLPFTTEVEEEDLRYIKLAVFYSFLVSRVIDIPIKNRNNKYIYWNFSDILECLKLAFVFGLGKEDYNEKILRIVEKLALEEEKNSTVYSASDLGILDSNGKRELSNFQEGMSKYIEDLFNGGWYEREPYIYKSIEDNFALDYLGAVRVNTKRIYLDENQEVVFNELLLKYYNSENDQPKNFVSKWLRKFEIGEELRFERIDGIGTIVKIKNGKGEPTNMADFGFGFSQIISMLIKIAVERTRLLIIEEPEINLHPNYQSLLADMFVDARDVFGTRFILETHSEYLVRRIQILTLEQKLKPKDTAIYYFYEPGKVPAGKKQIERLYILEDGNLDNDFGTGFFDEATKMKFDLMRLKYNKN